MRCLWITFAFLFIGFPSFIWAAPPILTGVFPAGGQQGTSVKSTLYGGFPEWPVQIWTNSTDITIESNKTSGVLDFKISPRATPGPKLFRLFNKDGASAVKSFWVGNIPEIEEIEPNNTSAKPQMVGTGPILINGKLGIDGDTDSFAIDAKKGQTIVAHLLGNHGLESPMDAVLQIVSPEGFILAENHDRFSLDPFISFNVLSSGLYRVRVFAFPSTPDTTIRFSGSFSYIYRLTITTGPYLDHVFPLAYQISKPQSFQIRGWNLSKNLTNISSDLPLTINGSRIFKPGLAGTFLVLPTAFNSLIFPPEKKLMQIDGPCIVSGCLHTEKENAFELMFKKGDKYKIKIEARSIGSDLDPVLIQMDAKGKEIKRIDDEGNANRDPALDVNSIGEPILIRVADLYQHTGETYYYRISIIPLKPDFDFSVEGESFTSKENKLVEIPVKITRNLGFADDIVIKVIDLPKGWTTEEIKINVKVANPIKLIVTPSEKAEPGFFKVLAKSGDTSKSSMRFLPAQESSIDHFFLFKEVKEKK